MSPTSALPRGFDFVGKRRLAPEKSRLPRRAGAQRFDLDKKKNAGALFVPRLLRVFFPLSLSVSFDRRGPPSFSSLSQPPSWPPSWINTP